MGCLWFRGQPFLLAVILKLDILNIIQEKTDHLTAEIKVEVQPEDFRPRVLQAIKKEGKKVSLPGFRAGMVPFQMIKKMIGKSVMVDELNHMLSESLFEYIKSENLLILGDPMPKSRLDGDEFDPDTDKALEFVYEVGLSPEIAVSFDNGTVVKKNEVTLDDAFVEKALEKERSYNGKYENTEEYMAGDTVIGSLAPYDETGEKLVESPKQFLVLSPQRVDALHFEPFTGKKLNEVVPFDMFSIAEDAEKLSSLFFIAADEVEQFRGQKTGFELSRLGRTTPADLNPEFFAKVLKQAPEEVENMTEAAFMEEFREIQNTNLQNEVKAEYEKAVRDWLLENHPADLPDDFLKRWLIATNEKVTEEVLEREYPDYARSVRWRLILDSLQATNKDDLFVEREDINAEMLVSLNFSVDEEADEAETEKKRDSYLKYAWGNEEFVEQIHSKLFNTKLFDFLESRVPTETVAVTATEFQSQR